MILVDYLEQNAQRYPEKPAVVCGGQTCTYAQLWHQVQHRASELSSLHLTPSTFRSALPLGSAKNLPHSTFHIPHCFRSTQDLDFLVTYLATHLAGGVATPLEHGMPEPLFQEVKARLQSAEIPEGIADILYTTGTTGQSKGVMISHRAMMADAENLIAGQGFSHDLVFVINGPLNHIGSLSKLWPCIMLGATILIIDGMKDLNAFFRALDYPATKMATFFVPATIRMILQFAPDKLASYAHKLDFIESGAAPLPQADMQRLCELLPTTRLYNTYASTETGIIATYNYNLNTEFPTPSRGGARGGVCGLPGCLGRPMPHSRLLITPEGLIACQGDTLMSGYAGDPELTATVLRDNTIFTSDVGTIDSEGMLHLSGRASDVINVGGFKVSPIEVESVAMSNSLVSDCICISADHPVTGRALKLLVVTPSNQPLDKRSLARYLADRLEPYKVPMLYEQVDTIARTYNGKLDRKHYQ